MSDDDEAVAFKAATDKIDLLERRLDELLEKREMGLELPFQPHNVWRDRTMNENKILRRRIAELETELKLRMCLRPIAELWEVDAIVFDEDGGLLGLCLRDEEPDPLATHFWPMDNLGVNNE